MVTRSSTWRIISAAGSLPLSRLASSNSRTSTIVLVMAWITGHDLTRTTKIYNKINERKARAIGLKRREHLALLADFEAGDNDIIAADLSECDSSVVGMKGGVSS